MGKFDFWKDIYSDYFGIEKLEKENEKLRRELGLSDDDTPILETEAQRAKRLKEEKEAPPKKEPVTTRRSTDSQSNRVDKGENGDAPETRRSLMTRSYTPLQDEASSIERRPSQNDEYERMTIERNKDAYDQKMVEWFAKIDTLYITDESKAFLKKEIEYMRKYKEKIETNYIPFHMQIITSNKETIRDISDIIYESSTMFSYVRYGIKCDLSLYNVTRKEEMERVYNDKNNVIVLRDLKGFELLDENTKDSILHAFDEKLNGTAGKTITIVTGKDKNEINGFFAKNSNMLEKDFAFQIVETIPDTQDVYNEVIEKLGTSIEVTEEMRVKLLDYIANTYPKTSLDFPSYRDNLYTSISFHKEVPSYAQDKTLEEIFAELDELVGLQKVKKVLNDLVDLIELKKKTKDDLKIKDVNLHMVFLGNPGTGKTTVARIISEILYNLGYVKQNKLIEASSKDLVGEFVGQTAPKTMGVIEKALGGVLFIDEAYSLASGHEKNSSFNEEAIATLIQGMENYRDNLVVIFAGYTKEMQDFLNANSGIVSRIGYTLEFDDYTQDELILIFRGMLKKAGFMVTEDAIEEVRKVIDQYKGTKNFGNARFIRNVYEKSVLKHASNTKNKKRKSILKTITKEDISTEGLLNM